MNTAKSKEPICTSCRRQKNQLKIKKSKLLPDFNIYLCNECIERRYEPRWIVIMAGRRNGPEYVKSYLKPRRYHGEEILLSELV